MTKKARRSYGLKNILNDAIKRLPIKEKKVIDLRFFKGRTQIEVANELAISQAQVSRLEKNAISSMKKYLRT